MDDVSANLDLLPRRPLVRSQGPLYRQLADVLRAPIANGTFAVGKELPKEAVIAERFNVSLITVRQALRDLEADGLIKKRSAKPAVIIASNPPIGFSWNFKNFADIAAFTKDARLKVKSYRKEVAPELERHFGLAKAEQGYCLRSVLAVDGQKKAHVTTYFPPDIGAKFKREDFTDVLIFRSVQRLLKVRMAVAHVTVRAEVASPAHAADLDIAAGDALVVVEMLYQSADLRNIEFSVARHPADRFSITYDAPNDLT